MKVKIADKKGIAECLRNQIVDIITHPRFENLYQFKHGKDTWLCSEFAIGEIIKEI